MVTYEDGARQLSRMWNQAIEDAARMAVRAGFHVSHLEYQQGEPHGTEARPVVLRGAYGRELARFWVQWPAFGSDDYTVTVKGGIAADVVEAADASP